MKQCRDLALPLEDWEERRAPGARLPDPPVVFVCDPMEERGLFSGLACFHYQVPGFTVKAWHSFGCQNSRANNKFSEHLLETRLQGIRCCFCPKILGKS